MEKNIKKATELITGGDTDPISTVLTQCAINIAGVAFCSMQGALRDKAIEVAKAIQDFDIELMARGKDS